MGRQKVPGGQARQIRARLRDYLIEQFGSLARFRLLAHQGGWLRPNTADRWLDDVDDNDDNVSVPDTASLIVLMRRTGLNPSWLLSGVGPQRDPVAQLALAAQEAETPPGFEGEWDEKDLEKAIFQHRLGPQPEAETGEPARTLPDAFGPGVFDSGVAQCTNCGARHTVGRHDLMCQCGAALPVVAETPSRAPLAVSAPKIPVAVLGPGFRDIPCPKCSKKFRQQLQDPADVTSWEPPCCFDCFDEKVEIPRRREVYDNENRRLLIRTDLNDLFDR
jgi:hypothetical protein